ncbi:MAG: hypothetical protein P8H88_04070 [Flavobacteriales bacterium]|nr:hypothetical protein [Flavobacteriales bacterium]
MDASKLQPWLDRGPRPEDVEALRALVARYPFAGPLRMMLAKASDMAQDLERREELLRAGAHVPSRRALFAYLMGPALVEEARAIHAEILASSDVSEEDMVGMVWHAQDVPPATSSAPESQEEEVVAKPEEPATREAMVAAIASVIEQDVERWNRVDVEGDAASEMPPDSATAQAHPARQSAGVEVPVLGSAPQPSSLFGQWLQQRARETGFGQPSLAEQGAGALIDAFLAKGDVRIGPVRESLESTEKWAAQGLVEDASLVTETMAKLYAQQGQIGRARKAYKLLALKYPEKSVYFAAQLKKLRNS